MQQTFVIGRNGNQQFPIDASHAYVHGEHAMMVADTASRNWYIEDLKARQTGKSNGVYLRDSNGEFRRVSACHIKPTDIVRLGPQNAQSYTFMAQHVLTPQNYNFEFAYMRDLERRLASEEAAQAKEVKQHNKISIIATIVVALLVAGTRMLVEMDPMVMAGLFAASPVIGGMVKLYFAGDNEKLKAIKARRAKLVQCPKCWRPLNDYDLSNGRCSACKAM